MVASLPQPFAELAGAFAAVAALDVHAVGDGVLVEGVEWLLELESRLRAVQSRWLAAADSREATVAETGRATRSFLIEELRVGPAEASRRCKLARLLPAAPHVQAALSVGEITADHASVILTLLEQVPGQVREVVEVELVKLAAVHPPYVLMRAVGEIRSRFGLDDDADERAARRHAERGADLDETFDGYGSLGAVLTPDVREALAKAFAAAGADTPAGPEDERTARQRRHDALAEIVGHYLATAELPGDSGERPRVVVTIDLDTLENELSAKWGTLDSGIPISPAMVRRLACDAEIIPAVLGARGEVLDLGVASRTFATAVRRAAKLRDGGRCAFPRCRRRVVDCHHILWWSRGGRSTLDNAAWLCAFHHWLIHERGWAICRNPDGSYTWTSPTGTETTGPPRHPRVA